MPEDTPSPSKKPRIEDGDRYLQPGSRATNKLNQHSDATPISMLSDDILFFIFSINSQIKMIPVNREFGITSETLCYEEDCLTTNRYSSQVCRRWRNIILSSPTIWANALNIDELNQPGDEWRYEIIDRTGNAPLTLVGRLGFESSREGNYAVPFVVDILSCEWHRIKYLSICTNETEIEEQMLYSLQEPAPSMEYFLYRTTKLDDQEPDLLPEGEMLFCNMSPRLRVTFICCGGLTFKFTPGAVSNVRQLWLAGHQASITIPELYHGLRQLPLLEELLINHHKLLESAELGNNTPSISLSRLTDIVINDNGPRLITDLVRHIKPAQGCRLVVPPRTLLRRMNSVDVPRVSQFYATFIKNIARFQDIPCISLSYRQNGGFVLRASDSSCQTNYSPTNYPYLTFGLPVYSHGTGISEQELSSLNAFSIPVMKALASRSDLGRVTTLQLELDDTTIAHCHAEILALLRELESVVELTTDIATLQVLIDIQADAGFVILPSMTTIILHGHTAPNHPLDAFLDGRLSSAVPVKVLKLPKDDHSDDGRWSFLKQNGLLVLWTRDRYGYWDAGEQELDLGS